MVVARDRTHLKTLIREAIREKGEYCDLNFIDVSRVTDMHRLFAKSKFNGDISKWNVPKNTNLLGMFVDSELERNNKIPKWHEQILFPFRRVK